MKKALAIGLAAVMAVSMSAPVFAEDEGKGIAKEDLKVGVIYIGDENEGYTAAHMKGIDEMEEKLGLDDSQIIEKTLIGEDEGCYDAAADLADQGCQIIFANSFGHETYILEAAGEYPEVQFCHATGTQAASSGNGSCSSRPIWPTRKSRRSAVSPTSSCKTSAATSV